VRREATHCLLGPVSATTKRNLTLLGPFSRPEQIEMAYAKGTREFVKCDDRWVSAASLKTANVLLAETRKAAIPRLLTRLKRSEEEQTMPLESLWR
jgi:hypothetical protein